MSSPHNCCYNEPLSAFRSLGVVLYVMLSGMSPFLGDTEEATIENIKNSHYSFPAEGWHSVSTIAQDLIRDLLREKQR